MNQNVIIPEGQEMIKIKDIGENPLGPRDQNIFGNKFLQGQKNQNHQGGEEKIINDILQDPDFRTLAIKDASLKKYILNNNYLQILAEKSVFAGKLQSLGYGKASLVNQRCQSAVFVSSVNKDETAGNNEAARAKNRPLSTVKVLNKKKPLLLKYIGSETKK